MPSVIGIVEMLGSSDPIILIPRGANEKELLSELYEVLCFWEDRLGAEKSSMESSLAIWNGWTNHRRFRLYCRTRMICLIYCKRIHTSTRLAARRKRRRH